MVLHWPLLRLRATFHSLSIHATYGQARGWMAAVALQTKLSFTIAVEAYNTIRYEHQPQRLSKRHRTRRSISQQSHGSLQASSKYCLYSVRYIYTCTIYTCIYSTGIYIYIYIIYIYLLPQLEAQRFGAIGYHMRDGGW